MWTASTIADARDQRGRCRGSVALVATMGALHRGHVSLIEAARKLAEQVVVSIFVNPTQFGPHEDFDRYPRDLDQDLAVCRAAGVAGVFCPPVEQMYPPGQAQCRITLPPLTDGLEGRCRPGHLEGVCWVVAKLLNLLRPDTACFGQKDYQQLKVIEALVDSLAMPVRVVGLPTVREGDGLAMSSRNAYLNRDQRQRALAVPQALHEARVLVENDGQTDPAVVEAAMRQKLETYDLSIDYAAVRHPQTLIKLDRIEPRLTGGVAALIAAWVDQVRLIDNMLLATPQTGSPEHRGKG